MLFGTGQVWGQNFGYITYTQGTDDGGSLAFYKDADCTSGNEISITNGKSDNLSGLDADGKVYIKVTPDESHQSRGVTITVEIEATGDPIRNVPWWDGEGNAPRRQAPSYNETITVETVAYGIYCFVMPDDGSNVTVTATFPTKTAWAQTTITPTTPLQDGDGYYLIGTAAELYGFAELVNNGNKTANAKLTADIVVNENVLDANGEANTGDFVQWTPFFIPALSTGRDTPSADSMSAAVAGVSDLLVE